MKNNEIRNMFINPRICTKDVLIKEFQYKVLHRYLPTNHLLFKMKKVDTNKCEFCNMYIESIPHLLYECFVVKDIWMQIQVCLSRLKDSEIRLSTKDVILGYSLEQMSPSNHLVNNLVLHVKYFLWKCKVAGTSPTRKKLKEYISCNKMFDQDLEFLYNELY